MVDEDTSAEQVPDRADHARPRSTMLLGALFIAAVVVLIARCRRDMLAAKSA
jgi:hypothetical protein